MNANIAAVGLAIMGAISLVLTAALYVAAWYVSRRPRKRGPAPAISVLKPLCGVDPGLYENLASLARQDYPTFELVLGAQDPRDPALAVAEHIARDFPRVRVVIVRGATTFGKNGKVENLRALMARARHEHVVISDANVRVGPEYLRALASELADPRVGLVSSLLAGSHDRGLGGVLESLHLNGFVLGVVSAAHLVRHPCVVGKSILLRRAALERLGGLEAVKDVLAEDYVLGQMFHRAGFRVALSPYPVSVVNQGRSVRDFWMRHLRWHQMRRWISPAAYLGEILVNPSVWLVAAALVAAVAGASGLAAAALGGVLTKSLLEVLVTVATPTAVRLRDFVWVPVKDFLILGAWLTGWVHRTVQWRGRRLLVTHGSYLFEPLWSRTIDVVRQEAA